MISLIFKAKEWEFDVSGKTLLMGIVNVTPDSFSDGGKCLEANSAIEHGVKLFSEGADIIDVGGESTRPGSQPVSAGEEIERVMPVIEGLVSEGIPVSVDTYKASVAGEALRAGACIVNDISGLNFDSDMAMTIAEYKAGAVLMHIQGTPRNMQINPHYDDLLGEISIYLVNSIKKAETAGIARENLIIDPGIGFGKNLDDNILILKNLAYFKKFNIPILLGVSRKSFIGKLLNKSVGERLYGTIGACAAAVMNGASMLRVHDVKEVSEAVQIIDRVLSSS